MQPNGVANKGEKLLHAGAEPHVNKYVLCLYVTGMAERSVAALAAVRALCDERLAGRYELDVIDLYQQPALARADQVIATPTLVKKRPSPLRRLVGDLSNRERVLAGLGL